MKNISFCISVFIGVISSSNTIFSATDQTYMSFGFGGDFSAGGDAYGSRDPRFLLQLEVGGPNLALPLSVSFGQNLTLLGLKPRLQHLLNLSGDQFKSISVGLGIAPVANYWLYSSSASDYQLIELGAQIASQVRWDANDQFFLSFTPLSLDFNFWRKFLSESAGLKALRAFFDIPDSNTELGVVYSVMLSAGMKF